jgi:hypothetical protein
MINDLQVAVVGRPKGIRTKKSAYLPIGTFGNSGFLYSHAAGCLLYGIKDVLWLKMWSTSS